VDHDQDFFMLSFLNAYNFILHWIVNLTAISCVYLFPYRNIWLLICVLIQPSFILILGSTLVHHIYVYKYYVIKWLYNTLDRQFIYGLHNHLLCSFMVYFNYENLYKMVYWTYNVCDITHYNLAFFYLLQVTFLN